MKFSLTHIGNTYETYIAKLGRLASRAFQSRYGLWFLGATSFVESVLVIPLISDPFLVGYILSNRTKVYRAVFVTTLTSVAGGVVAYLAAAFVIEIFLNTFTSVSPEELHQMTQHFETGTFLITLIGALTPVPYTVVAIAAGSVQANLFVFIAASFVGRGSRYVLVGAITYLIGPRALPLIQRYIRVLTVVLVVFLCAYIMYSFLNV